VAKPLLSVVVVALIGRDALSDCLDRLPLDEIECIVVFIKGMRSSSRWERRYPSVVFVEAPDEPVPRRRQRAVMAAKGDVVALLEDTSWPDEGWCTAVRGAFTDPETVAVGGPVKIAPTLESRCQALGWSEYGAFAPTQVAQQISKGAGQGEPIRTGRVPGNNMAFRRCELLELSRDGLIEGFVCARLLAQGRQILYVPQMLVTLSACDQRNVSLVTRLHHGRIYAASRLRGMGLSAKILHLAKTTLLPIVLTSRAMSAMKAASSSSVSFPVLIWVSLMASAWALGEAVGSMTGAGQSMRKWR
jgi:hypothetical protein